jgi:hypothetical protein
MMRRQNGTRNSSQDIIRIPDIRRDGGTIFDRPGISVLTHATNGLMSGAHLGKSFLCTLANP